jgi:hypothetical protein
MCYNVLKNKRIAMAANQRPPDDSDAEANAFFTSLNNGWIEFQDAKEEEKEIALIKILEAIIEADGYSFKMACVLLIFLKQFFTNNKESSEHKIFPIENFISLLKKRIAEEAKKSDGNIGNLRATIKKNIGMPLLNVFSAYWPVLEKEVENSIGNEIALLENKNPLSISDAKIHSDQPIRWKDESLITPDEAKLFLNKISTLEPILINGNYIPESKFRLYKFYEWFPHYYPSNYSSLNIPIKRIKLMSNSNINYDSILDIYYENEKKISYIVPFKEIEYFIEKLKKFNAMFYNSHAVDNRENKLDWRDLPYIYNIDDAWEPYRHMHTAICIDAVILASESKTSKINIIDAGCGQASIVLESIVKEIKKNCSQITSIQAIGIDFEQKNINVCQLSRNRMEGEYDIDVMPPDEKLKERTLYVKKDEGKWVYSVISPEGKRFENIPISLDLALIPAGPLTRESLAPFMDLIFETAAEVKHIPRPNIRFKQGDSKNIEPILNDANDAKAASEPSSARDSENIVIFSGSLTQATIGSKNIALNVLQSCWRGNATHLLVTGHTEILFTRTLLQQVGYEIAKSYEIYKKTKAETFIYFRLKKMSLDKMLSRIMKKLLKYPNELDLSFNASSSLFLHEISKNPAARRIKFINLIGSDISDWKALRAELEKFPELSQIHYHQHGSTDIPSDFINYLMGRGIALNFYPIENEFYGSDNFRRRTHFSFPKEIKEKNEDKKTEIKTASEEKKSSEIPISPALSQSERISTALSPDVPHTLPKPFYKTKNFWVSVILGLTGGIMIGLALSTAFPSIAIGWFIGGGAFAGGILSGGLSIHACKPHEITSTYLSVPPPSSSTTQIPFLSSSSPHQTPLAVVKIKNEVNKANATSSKDVLKTADTKVTPLSPARNSRR